jgi:hypothetical protein
VSGWVDNDKLETYTTLRHLAAHTSAKLTTLVTGMHDRTAGLFAKTVSTLDEHAGDLTACGGLSRRATIADFVILPGAAAPNAFRSGEAARPRRQRGSSGDAAWLKPWTRCGGRVDPASSVPS